MIALSVTFGFFLSWSELVSEALRKIASILMPIIYGAVLAYLMLSICNKTRICTMLKLKTVMKGESAIGRLAKTAGTLASLIVLFAIAAGLLSMIIPQIYTSIIGSQESIGEYASNLTLWMTRLFEGNPDVQQAVMLYHKQIMEEFQKWLAGKLVPNMSMITGQLSTGLSNVVTVMKNILIGVIVMAYLLSIKDTLATQPKKIIYNVFKLKEANRIASEVHFAHGVFGGFITSKPLDSLIIGIMYFFALKFLKMPYVFPISVIIGMTNVIPFFGPFTEAIPNAFLIPLVSPMRCLYFLIFMLILQQFDGNILGPRILGDSTGPPSFWALFSILLFDRLTGPAGVIIRVSTSTVIHRLTSIYVSNSLVKKDLSSRAGDYLHLGRIDEEEKIYIGRDIREQMLPLSDIGRYSGLLSRHEGGRPF